MLGKIRAKHPQTNENRHGRHSLVRAIPRYRSGIFVHLGKRREREGKHCGARRYSDVLYSDTDRRQRNRDRSLLVADGRTSSPTRWQQKQQKQAHSGQQAIVSGGPRANLRDDRQQSASVRILGSCAVEHRDRRDQQHSKYHDGGLSGIHRKHDSKHLVPAHLLGTARGEKRRQCRCRCRHSCHDTGRLGGLRLLRDCRRKKSPETIYQSVLSLSTNGKGRSTSLHGSIGLYHCQGNPGSHDRRMA
mmetsp:Transcript_8135/g.24062  ORF Transcript_8135/g.24062 Transcript_8135/m.24062 type:complete len:246 (+) Transcript_8135:325-1062(+)